MLVIEADLVEQADGTFLPRVTGTVDNDGPIDRARAEEARRLAYEPRHYASADGSRIFLALDRLALSSPRGLVETGRSEAQRLIGRHWAPGYGQPAPAFPMAG